jgi:hypothetical protein
MDAFKAVRACLFNGIFYHEGAEYQWRPSRPVPCEHLVPIGEVSPECRALIEERDRRINEYRAGLRIKARKRQAADEGNAATDAQLLSDVVAALRDATALIAEMRAELNAAKPAAKKKTVVDPLS